jgi:polyisoprenoid-binding protein YceI
MKRMNILAAALLISGSVFAQTTWNIDGNHSRIGFTVTHMAISEVEGEFKDFDAKIVSNSDDFNGAEVEFTAKVESISTENERRDNDLKSDNFFNAEKFPELKFKGKLVKEGSAYKLQGDFTIRDVTKPVTFDVTYGGSVDTGRGTKVGFKVTGTINRYDYNLKWDHKLPGGELVVSKDVDIVCKIELNKA